MEGQTPVAEDAPAAVLIPAAGDSRRMGDAGSKILAPLHGEPLIRHTVRVFQNHPGIGEIRIVCRDADRAEIEDCFADRNDWSKVGSPVTGGADRRESVSKGLGALVAGAPAVVLIHDGARPCCSAGLITRALSALRTLPAVIPTLPIHDTMRRRMPEARRETGRRQLEIPAAAHHDDTGVVEREAYVRTQTPQGFHWPVIWEAYRQDPLPGVAVTDDAQLAEAMGVPVAWIPGEERNIKITAPHDLELASWLVANPAWGISTPISDVSTA